MGINNELDDYFLQYFAIVVVRTRTYGIALIIL